MALNREFVRNFLDDLDIVQIIGQYTELKKRGREYKGLCPFHEEKTPSFTVNREKGLFKCYGCGAPGDVVTFVKDMEGLPDFNATVEKLCLIQGVQPVYDENPAKKKSASFAQHSLNRSVSFLNSFLLNSTTLPQLFTSNGLSKEDVEALNLAYIAPGKHPVSQGAKSKPAQIGGVDAGLLTKNADGTFRDALSGMVLLPVKAKNDNVLGIYALRPEKEDPRVEWAGTLKQPVVLGLESALLRVSQARSKAHGEALQGEDVLFLCDHPWDYLGLYGAGLRNIACLNPGADMGHLTIQAEKLAKRQPDVVLVSRNISLPVLTAWASIEGTFNESASETPVIDVVSLQGKPFPAGLLGTRDPARIATEIRKGKKNLGDSLVNIVKTAPPEKRQALALKIIGSLPRTPYRAMLGNEFEQILKATPAPTPNRSAAQGKAAAPTSSLLRPSVL